MTTPGQTDIIIVGAGHNGLVAATFLARAGLTVRVLEERDVIGGACRTEYPFKTAPKLAASTGAYLLGLMPPELIAKLGINLPLVRRDPHYFLPTTGKRYLLFGSNRQAMRDQFLTFFSEQDWKANEALQAELDQLREDIAPTWLQEPVSIEDTADRFVRPKLRQVFVNLCRGSVGAYLERFGFKSDLLKVMYAVTDGFSGLNGTWDTPGTGMNFLVHNMCRLPGADGTWMIVRGGMGTVTRQLADAARKAGATIETGKPVREIIVENGAVTGVDDYRARVVLVNADPFRMSQLAGLPSPNRYRKDGTTMKVNLCLKALPKFTCLPEDCGQFSTTTHLLPDDPMRSVREAFASVQRGELPDFPTIEWYVHPTMCDEAGHLSAALFVQWVPYTLAGTTWEKEEGRYVSHLLSICDRFAPGTSDLVQETFTLTPPKIESYFGITRGHIHHIDNSFGFADRLPYAQPVGGLYSCSAGCHPAGSVIGAAGHNAAMRILKDLGIGGHRRQNVTGKLVRAGSEEADKMDREFWRSVGAEGRFSAAWEMVGEVNAIRGGDGSQPRLQRSVQSVQRWSR